MLCRRVSKNKAIISDRESPSSWLHVFPFWAQCRTWRRSQDLLRALSCYILQGTACNYRGCHNSSSSISTCRCSDLTDTRGSFLFNFGAFALFQFSTVSVFSLPRRSWIAIIFQMATWCCWPHLKAGFPSRFFSQKKLRSPKPWFNLLYFLFSGCPHS